MRYIIPHLDPSPQPDKSMPTVYIIFLPTAGSGIFDNCCCNIFLSSSSSCICPVSGAGHGVLLQCGISPFIPAKYTIGNDIRGR